MYHEGCITKVVSWRMFSKGCTAKGVSQRVYCEGCIITQYVVSKGWNWLLRAQKSLVTMIKLPLFVIKIIDIGLNYQNNYPVYGFQGSGTGLLRVHKSLVTMIKLPLFVINIIDIGLNHQNNYPLCGCILRYVL